MFKIIWFFNLLLSIALVSTAEEWHIFQTCSWGSYSHSQNARCWTQLFNVNSHTVRVRIICWDKEKWPDIEGVYLEISIIPFHWGEFIPDEDFTNARAMLLVRLIDGEPLDKRGEIKYVPFKGKDTEETEREDYAGEWDISEWKVENANFENGFLVVKGYEYDMAVLFIPYRVKVLRWSVLAEVYAYEDYCSGYGYGHKGKICFVCKRD